MLIYSLVSFVLLFRDQDPSRGSRGYPTVRTTKAFSFFANYSTDADTNHPYKRVHTPYPYKYIRKAEIELSDLEVDEITTDVSLLMGTLPTTERTMTLNPKINTKNMNTDVKSKIESYRISSIPRNPTS